MAKQQNQFSDDEIAQIKRYGQALGGSPTPFDEEVDRQAWLHEAHYAKMRAAQTAGSGLGPTKMEQRAEPSKPLGPAPAGN